MFRCEEFLQSELFERVQMLRLFPDSKTFADAKPRDSYAKALDAYHQSKPADGDLLRFVDQYFELRLADESKGDGEAQDLHSFIETTWTKLIRPADNLDEESSLLPLPNRYLVPGGRFQEIYYWDTYFTALGLIESNEHQLVKDMLDNFVHLQQSYGLIPNGNRVYYLSRSQPPILALMVALLRDNVSSSNGNANGKLEGNFKPKDYLPYLIQEHEFWTSGENNPRAVNTATGFVASRYWDDLQAPRPESFYEDIELAKHIDASKRGLFFRNLRAACESGWDFSSRWLMQSNDLASINTTEILPVDLNALLGISEQTISDIAQADGQVSIAQNFRELRAKRQQFFNDYFWQAKENSFFDLNISDLSATGVRSLASVVPLFAGLANAEQASEIARDIETSFLHPGGLATSLQDTQQQWDFPNAWAPLQWFAIQGLKHYAHKELAAKVTQAWLENVGDFYKSKGVMMEKYNVINTKTAAQGGEYEVQLGFGWTNGVTLALLNQA